MIYEFMNHLNNVMDKPFGYSYELNSRGTKYYKITSRDRSGPHGVYVFVNKETGDIFKPASWRGPAKGVRGNINVPESYKNSDWHGGWLYKIYGNVYEEVSDPS